MRDRTAPLLFLLPALAGLALFRLYPIVLAARESLYTESFVTGMKRFVGLGNYASLFDDPAFLNSLAVTLRFNLIINPLQVIAAVLVAALLNQQVKGLKAFRSVAYLPLAVSLPIASVIWGLLLNPNQGFVNRVLVTLGFPPQPFLVSADQALYSIILIASWIGISYWMVFILAALQEVPTQLYEAATIDGASSFQAFTRVTLPLLKRAIAFVAIGATTSNFLLFAPSYILTRGGPAGSTDMLMYEAYMNAFSYSDMGRSSAIVVLLLSMMLVAVLWEMRMFRAAED